MEGKSSTVSVFGATGLIGGSVIRALMEDGYSIRIFARNVEKSRDMFPEVKEHIRWDYTRDDWKQNLEGSAVVINFSGAPIFQKWKGNYRKEIWDSRVEATKQIVDAISRCTEKPGLLINGSASGIYGYDSFDDREVDESSPPGRDFWGDLVTAWEKEAMAAASMGDECVRFICQGWCMIDHDHLEITKFSQARQRILYVILPALPDYYEPIARSVRLQEYINCASAEGLHIDLIGQFP